MLLIQLLAFCFFFYSEAYVSLAESIFRTISPFLRLYFTTLQQMRSIELLLYFLSIFDSKSLKYPPK